MTDKELLELAAKAAGYEVSVSTNGFYFEDHDCCGGISWNPLTDDGDRYRLAKNLNMRVYFDIGVRFFTKSDDLIEILIGQDESDIDRCIVRAAAEIGKTMK